MNVDKKSWCQFRKLTLPVLAFHGPNWGIVGVCHVMETRGLLLELVGNGRHMCKNKMTRESFDDNKGS